MTVQKINVTALCVVQRQYDILYMHSSKYPGNKMCLILLQKMISDMKFMGLPLFLI